MSIINCKLISCFYEDNKLFVTIKHKKKEVFQVNFYPYFYLVFKNLPTEEQLKDIQDKTSAKEIVLTEKENKKNTYKIIFENVSLLISAKEILQEKIQNIYYSLYEYDIPFVQRFFLDNKITNFIDVTITLENNIVTDIKPISRKINLSNLETGCFDIEVLVSENLSFPDPKQQPIISISYMDSQKNKYCFLNVKEKETEKIKKKIEEELKCFCFVYSSEKEMLLGFINFLEKKDPDIIYTYNGIFDFNYINQAYKRLFDEDLKIKNYFLSFNRYPNNKVSLKETVHIDVYQLLKMLRYFQAINLAKLDLNTVYALITNKKKVVLSPKEMRKNYLNKEYLKIVKYNLDDVVATMELAEMYVDFIFGICSFLDVPIDDVLFFAASMIVEKLFMGDYITRNQIIPNKPNQYQISARKKKVFAGGFVYQPKAGLYKNIAIVDFRTYHVSLLISYNISPETINVKENYKEVNNIKISQKKEGFVPSILKRLIEYRVNLKKELLNFNKESVEYRSIYRRQFATKTLIASIYGYMGFAASRWYCSECLDAMYYLVRTKIQDLIKTFESKNYVVLYADTDSNFVQFEDIKKLKEDIQKINEKLPNNMVLELEDVFKSGIFVKARDEIKTAKKKYALLDYNNNLKIKGFEFVRRDWCTLVKDTQKKILYFVLEEEDYKKATSFVKEVINDIYDKKADVKDLVIQSFVRKNTSKYKTKNPAQSALISAKEKGLNISNKDVVEYVITDKGKTVSEKAKVIELVKDKEYDANYYVEKQLIPAIFPILNVFGVSKEELISNTKQKNLKDFFK
jgi:DNA polymerase, archaea type